ncbi:uncharacterized protein VTP21DRAFT_6085 [Calcarisporiella thermophila]|uniref:uncharacterized protein n=1 Tax=Calcarisporiella thermophila TaxID=911321 RepID=UPI0037425FEE
MIQALPQQQQEENSSTETLLRRLFEETAISARSTHPSSQEHQEVVRQYCLLIENVVRDCLVPLCDSGAEISEIDLAQARTALRLIEHAFTRMSDVIVRAPAPTQHSSQIVSQKQQNEVGRFNIWVLGHLLPVLSRANLATLHAQTSRAASIVVGALGIRLPNLSTLREVVQSMLGVIHSVGALVQPSESDKEDNFPLDVDLFAGHMLTVDSKAEAINLFGYLIEIMVDVFERERFLSGIYVEAWVVLLKAVEWGIELEWGSPLLNVSQPNYIHI